MSNHGSHIWELKVRVWHKPCSPLRWWLVVFRASVSLIALSTRQSSPEVL